MGELNLHGKRPDIWTSMLNMRRQRVQVSARGYENLTRAELEHVVCILSYEVFCGKDG